MVAHASCSTGASKDPEVIKESSSLPGRLPGRRRTMELAALAALPRRGGIPNCPGVTSPAASGEPANRAGDAGHLLAPWPGDRGGLLKGTLAGCIPRAPRSLGDLEEDDNSKGRNEASGTWRRYARSFSVTQRRLVATVLKNTGSREPTAG